MYYNKNNSKMIGFYKRYVPFYRHDWQMYRDIQKGEAFMERKSYFLIWEYDRIYCDSLCSWNGNEGIAFSIDGDLSGVLQNDVVATIR